MKKVLVFVASFIVFLMAGSLYVIVIDPFFHYHQPLQSLSYRLWDERYINDGIERHFEYDAMITGSSMTENFKTSELDELFGCHSIKVPFSGEYYRGVNDSIDRAVHYNPDIRIIVRGIDYNALSKGKDEFRYEDSQYPTYLWNNNPFDDVQYVLNKEVLIGEAYVTVLRTKNGEPSTTFDQYKNWANDYSYGKEAVLGYYERPEKQSEKYVPLAKDSIEQNILRTVRENPQIEFYYFFTPYSIYYWDSVNQDGTLKSQLLMEKETIEMMLEYDNLHLFSFFDEFEMICDVNNYKDPGHYGEWINSYILQCMRYGQHEITKENYEDYCDNTYNFYTTFNYESLF